MIEKDVERQLVREVRAVGGMCLKFTSAGTDGIPDRLVLLKKGRLAFVELKAPGKKPRALQIKRMKQISDLGFKCFVIDNTDDIPRIIDEIGGDD